jgi:type IV secretory system conjugative DNA transfer VirD4/TraG family protein
MNRQQVTERPAQSLAILSRLAAAAFVVFAICEGSVQFASSDVLKNGPLGPLARILVRPVLLKYWPIRVWILEHPALVVSGVLASMVLIIFVVRFSLLLWHNEVVARLAGTRLKADKFRFPNAKFDLLKAIGRRPKGSCFVGMTPRRRLLFWSWRPVYISQRQKSMHRHVIGKTGSGKTASILWPSVLQDALDGKGILVMSAKGSDEEIKTMKAIATLADRKPALKVLALPAWNQPQLFSHHYNMVYVRPQTKHSPGGDPATTAERVFSVLPLGNNEYYNTQAQIMFTNLCKLLHGMVDEDCNGLPFVLKDIAVCFKGLGLGFDGAWTRALNHCLTHSLEQEAAREIKSQAWRLGKDVHKCFSGVVGAIDKFLSPIVNAYAPDIIFENVLEKNELVYVQLPANLFKTQAPALGKVVLMDVQQEGSLRQVFRTKNQRPFAVVVDEFYNFADLSIIDSLNKLRDANLEFTLAHQSLADLELVSKEFATAVWDNTRTKDILNQDNPELCDKLAKSIGTRQIVEKTVRMQQGALLTSLTTGDASSKLVEAYKLHPNAIKTLARCGQGYLFNDEDLRPLSYGMLPPLSSDFPLARNNQTLARGLRLYETIVATGAV